jgi:hypothetical protein
MSLTIHSPPEHAEPIVRWYRRAQVDYVEYYIRMYVAYNAWYREVTMSMNDREALALLKKRVIIWDDYANGKTMRSLRTYMERLVDVTQHQPLGSTAHWNGTVNSATDWRSLIEFWYQVRCLLVHGSAVDAKYVWLAYETLDVFMGEIVSRIHKTLKSYEAAFGTASTPTPDSSLASKVSEVQRKMYAKYITSPDIWHVDMKRVA